MTKMINLPKVTFVLSQISLNSEALAGFEPTNFQIPVRYSITVLWETHGRLGLQLAGFSSNLKIQRKL